MMKSVLALIGAAVLLLGFATYHYGFLSKKIDDVSTQIDRETAVARAENRIRDIEKRAEELETKARDLRIKARTREIGIEREEESQGKRTQLRTAMKSLADSMKANGLPKPSELSPDDLKKEFPYGGKNYKVQDAIKLLTQWQKDLNDRETNAVRQQSLIGKMRAAADQLESQREKMLALVTDVRGKLEDLAMQRDMAKVEAELAELKATSSGAYSGDLGATLKTIQKEIDEKLATVEVLQAETAAAELANPEAALQSVETAGTALQGLDKLFE